jgi:carbonic anhydrase/acetyltransferase-like protein (isoleucine patch superfamily)
VGIRDGVGVEVVVDSILVGEKAVVVDRVMVGKRVVVGERVVVDI